MGMEPPWIKNLSMIANLLRLQLGKSSDLARGEIMSLDFGETLK